MLVIRYAWLFIAALALLFVGMPIGHTKQKSSAAGQTDSRPVQVVAHVDLKRYTGQWYEIAAIPMFFERRCVGDTLANYTLLPNGQLEVVNSCKIQSGKRISSTGRARVKKGESTNAKLEVSFVNVLGWQWFFAGGDYWIIGLDPDYQYALIGHPTRKYGWVLSRSPQLSLSTLIEIGKQLRAQGYDTCSFLTMPQHGGLSKRLPLCQLTD